MTRRRKNSITENFIVHPRSLRESAAWHALPDNGRRILDRLELEHMRHGGAENGHLPCTYSDFVKAGVRRASVSLAIRQAVALGFLEVTQRGGRSISRVRPPSKYRLTYINGRGRSQPATNEWKRIADAADAEAALTRAADQRNHESQPLRCASSGLKHKKTGRGSASGAGRANGTAQYPQPDALAELHV
jgi:hypothetical protein